MNDTFADYKQKLLLYCNGYLEQIDASEQASIPEAAMQAMKSNLQRNLSELQQEVWEVNQAIEGISDILYLPRLSMGEVEDNYEETIDFIERKQQAILDYEAGYQQEVQELHELTSATRGMIREYRDKDRASETYESGDYAKSAAIESLAVSMGNYIRYTEEHASELKKAAENQERIQQEKEEKERAKERKKEGLWQTAGGLLSVAAGGFAIAATAGAATPVIVTVGTGAIGGVNVAYGAAETIEGVQETYYGVTGDGKSASVNYLRDVVFGGKEKYRGDGINYVIYNNFDNILSPRNVTPVN